MTNSDGHTNAGPAVPTAPGDGQSSGAENVRGAERQRLRDADLYSVPWRKWGPYLAERAWGTVREDYSADGNAWSYFPFEQAVSRAYRWSEDGLGGICDEDQMICLGLSLWNGQDPVLKERLFGLTNSQGNHGEDVRRAGGTWTPRPRRAG
jgi:hypothetical protein